MLLDTTSNRASAFFSKLSSVFVLLCAIITVQNIVETPSAEQIHPANVHYAKYKPARFYHAFHNKKQNYAQVKFDLDADFSNLWTWNTKHVVVYLVASYPTEKHDLNDVVVWDRILSTPDESHLQVKNALSNLHAHPFNEYSNDFSNLEANYTMHWTVSPKLGFLTWGSGISSLAVPFTKI
ncbi:signal peptidase subunit Spc3 [Schizosaccharomyces osmophilus]|uniref:Signal peptidase subunit 3 n=1 Tax=Schizosaccharomyces osmophilus TaxID=2545709 RepID=A0AAF0AVF9_9SCHI|nr:signal peptidase subunit Spc3 [Schizosaccharomyces osmophilus]WBW71945.1 signal peptidase subunit Spc3 [Schizosaccharomyces osmophilus]